MSIKTMLCYAKFHLKQSPYVEEHEYITGSFFFSPKKGRPKKQKTSLTLII